MCWSVHLPLIEREEGSMEWNEFDRICPLCAACVAPLAQFCWAAVAQFCRGLGRFSPHTLQGAAFAPLVWTMRECKVDHGREREQSFVVASLCRKPPGWSVASSDTMSGSWSGHKTNFCRRHFQFSTSESLELRGKQKIPRQSYKVLCSAFRS